MKYFLSLALCLLFLPCTYGVPAHLNFDNITTENGLSNNYVSCVKQDKEGWIWIGTSMGIEKFDGIKFKHYTIQINDSTSIKNFLIRNFFESKNGAFYACIEEYGLVKYNKRKDAFERLILKNTPVLTDFSVKRIIEDKDGNLWVATKDGICKVDLKTGKITPLKNDKGNPRSLIDNYVRTVLLDESDKLWIGTMSGLDMYDLNTEKLIHFSSITPLLADDIHEICLDQNGRKWIATGNHGVIIVDKNNTTFQRLVLNNKDARSLTVRSLFRDKENNFWIGTRGGLYHCDVQGNNIQLFQNNLLEPKSLVHNSILNIMQDKKGDLWVATRGGLGHLVMEKQVFTTYIAIPDNNNYLNNKEIYCIYEDPGKNIYLGTESGGVNVLQSRTGQFKYLTKEGKQLSNNCIKSIVGMASGKILFGTFMGGLNLYAPKTGKTKFFRHHENDASSISSDIVWDICISEQNNIWIGTAAGLDQFNPVQGTFTHFTQFNDMINGVTWLDLDKDNDLWLGSEEIRIFRPGKGVINTFQEKTRDLFVDSQGRHWIMTIDKGIIQYDKYNGALKSYTEEDGLSSNLTFRMLEDDANQLWISTANGLSCFNPDTETFENYFRVDGLQGNQFNYGAAYKTKNGELVFGGINGFIRFNPKEITKSQYIPPVYITDIRVNNNSYLTSGAYEISHSEEPLKLPHDSKVLSFDFVALNYANSSQNQYRYMLEGFDQDFKEASEMSSATYTNLNPGNYTFKVIASNNKGKWNTSGASKAFVIVPPFYKTTGFYIFFVIFSLLTLILSYVRILKALASKKNLEFERKEAIRQHELDASKLQFFTNISHEIKTPLTLIISPLEKILHFDISQKEVKENLSLMHRNAKQLMQLITQLLDYRTLEAGKLRVENKKGDVVKFAKENFTAFSTLMKEAQLSYTFKSVQDEMVTDFDADKLKKIIDNLVTNAIKYNKPGGSISFLISLVFNELEGNGKYDQYIKLVIKDTGIGIAEKNLQNIFKRFFREENQNSTSSGIGLSFTKDLVKLLDGTISVESKIDKGSIFTVLIPYINKEEEMLGGINETVAYEQVEEIEITLSENTDNKKIVLIVEDNKDVRQFLRSHFQKEYHVYEASNGKTGLEIALKTIPDIIISDIMMPEMQGNELCAILKKDERTSHIPIVLLTALSSKKDVLEGLLKGADDYISKPFDISILQTKVDNLLQTRFALRQKYMKEILLQPSKVDLKSPDEKFLQKALQVVEKHIDDPKLDIEMFGEEMAISRMQLYRKMAALTNMTVKEFINDIRLKRAYQLLTESKLTVSEVGYAVGFNDISYFGKCIRKKYNMNATEIIKTKRLAHR